MPSAHPTFSQGWRRRCRYSHYASLSVSVERGARGSATTASVHIHPPGKGRCCRTTLGHRVHGLGRDRHVPARLCPQLTALGTHGSRPASHFSYLHDQTCTAYSAPVTSPRPCAFPSRAQSPSKHNVIPSITRSWSRAAHRGGCYPSLNPPPDCLHPSIRGSSASLPCVSIIPFLLLMEKIICGHLK